jgi:hypothetical protein
MCTGLILFSPSAVTSHPVLLLHHSSLLKATTPRGPSWQLTCSSSSSTPQSQRQICGLSKPQRPSPSPLNQFTLVPLRLWIETPPKVPTLSWRRLCYPQRCTISMCWIDRVSKKASIPVMVALEDVQAFQSHAHAVLEVVRSHLQCSFRDTQSSTAPYINNVIIIRIGENLLYSGIEKTGTCLWFVGGGARGGRTPAP